MKLGPSVSIVAWVVASGVCVGASGQVRAPSPSTPERTQPAPKDRPEAPPERARPEATPAPRAASPDVDLRPRFKLGADRRLRIDTRSITTTRGGIDVDSILNPGGAKKGAEPEDKSSATQEWVLIFRPKELIEGGGAKVEVEFESIKAKIENSMGVDEFDSTKPAKKPAAQPDPLARLSGIGMLDSMLRPLVGETMRVTFDRDGQVVSVEGGEKFAAVFEGAAGGIGLPGGAGAAGGAGEAGGGGGGGGGAKSLIGRILSPAPGKATARVGESWTTRDTFDLSLAGRLRLTSTTKVRETRGGVAKLDLDGTIEPDSPGAGGGLVSIKGGTHKGGAEWDIEDGFIRAMNLAQTLEAETEIAGMKSSSTSVQTTTVTRVR